MPQSVGRMRQIGSTTAGYIRTSSDERDHPLPRDDRDWGFRTNARASNPIEQLESSHSTLLRRRHTFRTKCLHTAIGSAERAARKIDSQAPELMTFHRLPRTLDYFGIGIRLRVPAAISSTTILCKCLQLRLSEDVFHVGVHRGEHVRPFGISRTAVQDDVV